MGAESCSKRRPPVAMSKLAGGAPKSGSGPEMENVELGRDTLTLSLALTLFASGVTKAVGHEQ